MRVGIDARPLDERPTGIGVYTREIMKFLSTITGIDVFLYSNRNISWNGNGTKWVSSSVAGPLWRNVILPRQLREHNIDVFWGSLGTLPIVKVRPKTVITIHDLLWIDLPKTLTFRDKIGRRLQMSNAIQKADAVIAVSDFTAQRLKTHYSRTHNTFVVPEASRFPPQTTSESLLISKNILAIGGNEFRKNNEFLVKAFEKSSLLERGWTLTVVGRGSSALRSSTDAVHLLDYVPDEDLVTAYKNAGAVVIASTYEGFGLPVVEALGFKKPLLVSSIPPFREFGLPKNAYFDPFDLNSCIRIMEQLVDDIWRDEFVRQTAGIIADWPSWNEIGQLTFDVMRKVAY